MALGFKNKRKVYINYWQIPLKISVCRFTVHFSFIFLFKNGWKVICRRKHFCWEKIIEMRLLGKCIDRKWKKSLINIDAKIINETLMLQVEKKHNIAGFYRYSKMV